ncbi:MAG: hypothetical protein O2892_09080 [Actinomycetota bacterium]|nr:hypothetical protein [Actinomycetota bacterium]MDA2949181.1 hypothetical protein [Actinomycetota bacterium]
MAEVEGGVDVALAAKAFREQCELWTERQPLWDGQVARWQPGLLGRLRQAITAQSAAGRRAVAGSRAPGRIDVISLLSELETEVASWAPGGIETGLRTMAGATYSPADVRTLQTRTARLQQLGIEAARLLGDAPIEVPLRSACPVCNRLVFHRGQERIRTWCLVATGAGVECRGPGCEAFYAPSAFGLLAQILTGA